MEVPSKGSTRSGSFHIFKQDDGEDDTSVDPSVCSAPELTASTHKSFTFLRSGSFQIREKKMLRRMQEEEITFHPPTVSTIKKQIQAASVTAPEDMMATLSVAKAPRRGLKLKLFGVGKADAPLETGRTFKTESSTDGSSLGENDTASTNAAKDFDCIGRKVSFGLPHVVTVSSWRGEDLWWTKSELHLSHCAQSAMLVNDDQVKRYLYRYEQAQEKLNLSQIYNLDGKPYLEKLPGGVKRGLRAGHAGLEVFSLLENRRRVRSRAIVRSVVELSVSTKDTVEVCRHAQRLNAPSLQWAIMMAEAHQKYDRLLDI